ncbi:MAG: ABC-2 transporter permease [Syntrophobacteraceae bacterium]
MYNILKTIKLDYYILMTFSPWLLLLVFVIAALIGIISSEPEFIIGIVLMTSAFFMTSLFAVAEKNNLNTLYGTLPVTKPDIVAGRYLFSLLVGFLNAVLATFAAVFISRVFQFETTNPTLAAWLCGSFFLYCLLISVQFPLYFRYDFSRISAVANTPLVVLFIAIALILGKSPELMGQAAEFFVDNTYAMWLTGIVGGIFLLGVSMLLAIVLYRRRELGG